MLNELLNNAFLDTYMSILFILCFFIGAFKLDSLIEKLFPTFHKNHAFINFLLIIVLGLLFIAAILHKVYYV